MTLHAKISRIQRIYTPLRVCTRILAVFGVHTKWPRRNFAITYPKLWSRCQSIDLNENQTQTQSELESNLDSESYSHTQAKSSK